jgi:hypothetical protein
MTDMSPNERLLRLPQGAPGQKAAIGGVPDGRMETAPKSRNENLLFRPSSAAGPRTCAAEDFLHQYQHDMLSLVEQVRELRHPAGADIQPPKVSGSREDHPRPGTVILHLVPVPGSWPSTPERRLARVLKYALRTAGYRATRITPVV